ncbi:MAG TPA: DUF3093 domain-containing protein [Streptosporangiaceae bacterium]
MREYSERLGVPASWWLLVVACAALLGTTLWAGLSVATAIVIYAVLEGACVVLLLGWGAATITVTSSELAAGSRRLPLARIAEVAAMDAAQTRALRGPRADPAAYLLVRPYLPQAVYVRVAGSPPEPPYWLIATRKPAELAAAIERARPGRRTSAADGHAEDGGVTHQAPGAVG